MNFYEVFLSFIAFSYATFGGRDPFEETHKGFTVGGRDSFRFKISY